MNMKRKIIAVVSIAILISIIFTFNSQIKKLKLQVSWIKLAEGFVSAPDSIQTSVYVYWFSDNISKERVVITTR